MADANAELSEQFELHRSHLVGVAYCILGSLADAEDVVQDAWLRLQRADAGAIRELRSWLTTVVGRLALDALGSARSRREVYVGPWLPEPLVSGAADVPGPAERVTLDDSVSMALLVVLERLSPAERSAFLLHDVFGLEFREVAEVVGRTPAAVRQLAARARRHVEAGRPRFPASRDEQTEIVSAFAAACGEGDLDELLALLDPEVVWRSDGGGKVQASRRPQRGAHRVARAMLAFSVRPARTGRLADVAGGPGLVLRDADDVLTVMAFTLDAGRILAIDVVRNPDKLRHVAA